MRAGGPRLIRAAYSAETITVYQAYPPDIAEAALDAGTLVPPFNRDRMTWIKPSFGWMMHRSGWATKPGQQRILAITISREGFEWALANSCLTHFTRDLYGTPQDWAAARDDASVLVQWNPGRSLTDERLPGRTIRVGLSGVAVKRYADEWIEAIADLTDLVWQAGKLVQAGQVGDARRELPVERVYPLDTALALRIGAYDSYQTVPDFLTGGPLPDPPDPPPGRPGTPATPGTPAPVSYSPVT